MTQTAARPFEGNLGHLLGELALLDLRLAHQVRRLRADGRQDDDFRGLLVTHQQVDGILSGPSPGLVALEPDEGPQVADLRRRVEDLEARTGESLRSGVPLRLERLRRLFNLNTFEAEVLVVCLAPEVDLKYEAVYAFLQDDVGKKRPTVNLVLSLLCDTLAQRVAQRHSLQQSAPLRSHGLVHLVEDQYSRDAPFLGHALKLDQRVAEYLLGSDLPDDRLRSLARLTQPESSWEQVWLPAEVKGPLVWLAENLADAMVGHAGMVLQLIGLRGAGKQSVAQALCRALGKQLLVADCRGLLGPDRLDYNPVQLAFREALIQDALVCWQDCHLLVGNEAPQRAARAALTEALREYPGLAILTGESPWHPEDALEDRLQQTVVLPMPDFPQRRRFWEHYLAAEECRLPEEEIALVASKFRFTGGQIKLVAATARQLARWRSWGPGEGGNITLEDLQAASRWHSNQGLAVLAQKVAPRYSWEDIVLPQEQKAQLREICSYFRNMPLVYDQWGFQSKTARGKGLNALFAGPSGTGKTMAAEIIAGELALDLYKIDLSSVVSKYIGETEKNLDRIFQEAEGSNAILFFDEADALFGKRSEVKDAHDRYANIEISYLLQKMEDYQGIVILATNLRKNMDDAFVRRLHFAVDLPFPEEPDRLGIWRRIFPPEAPLDQRVELGFLARQFKMTGGSIKNIAVTAAFLAAEERKPIGMEQIIRATRREYQKMGRLLVESDFGPYVGLVRGDSRAQETRDGATR